ncbi:DNA polymerase III subunit gamma and tau [Pseudonocardia phyllosphaerae]|uniref:DNA polymerase III subunit gamma and tau n=1 Tax=Pseudonocardia phyllosphaerae TaxID=3390502 RepID=UPI003978DC57
MGLALYRKYRPAKLADVVGQEHVTEPLATALAAGRINHAYLFSGPRGCGKTSSARILARSLNCVQGPTPDPCGECSSCISLAPEGPGNIDVVELDAASHGGVEDARELRDRAFYAPAESRYRVFIIDEAHMVTSQGFNALLKIVEEPPEHLVFVFATTEPEKVLPTIRSRTHHYPFRLIPPGTMRQLLEKICGEEGVSVAPPVYPLVIRAGGGSARDTLSVLDQLLAGAGPEGVTYERAVALLGVTDSALIDDAVDALAAADGAAVYGAVDRLVEAGHDPRRFASDLLQRFRDITLLQAVPDAAEQGLVDGAEDELARMADQAARLGSATVTRYGEILHQGLIDMRGATAPRLLLELLCARMLLPAATTSDGGMLERLERIERRNAIAPESGAGDSGDGGGRRFVRPSERASAPAAESAAPAPEAPAARPERPAEQAPAVPEPTARRDEQPEAREPEPARTDATGADPAVRADDHAARDAEPRPAEAGAAGDAVGHAAAAAAPTAGAPPAEAPATDASAAAASADADAPTGTADRPAADRPAADRSAAERPAPDGPAADRRPEGRPEFVRPSDRERPQQPAGSDARPEASPEHQDRPAPAGPATAERPGGAESDTGHPAPPRDGAPADAAPPSSAQPAPATSSLDATAVRRVWPEILAAVRQRSRSTEALLANATVRAVDGDVLVLTIAAPPLARRLSEPRNTDVVSEALHAVLGVRWQVRCDQGDAGGTRARPPEQRQQKPPLQRPSERRAPQRPSQQGRQGGENRGSGGDGIPLPPEPPPEDAPPDPHGDDGSRSAAGPQRPRTKKDEAADEEAMLAEAAAESAAPGERRDPEAAAIELLSAQLGAKALDQRR